MALALPQPPVSNSVCGLESGWTARHLTRPRASSQPVRETETSPVLDRDDATSTPKPRQGSCNANGGYPPILRRKTWPVGLSSAASKTVHFDSQENVRCFLEAEPPLAVSSSRRRRSITPTKTYKQNPVPSRVAMTLVNFPFQLPPPSVGSTREVSLDQLWISDERNRLLATVSVRNLAYDKYVCCRYTHDGWKTTHEVAGAYLGSATPDRDTFALTIHLPSIARLAEGKTFQLCFHYVVAGDEFWDNNGGANYIVWLHRSPPQFTCGTS